MNCFTEALMAALRSADWRASRSLQAAFSAKAVLPDHRRRPDRRRGDQSAVSPSNLPATYQALGARARIGSSRR